MSEPAPARASQIDVFRSGTGEVFFKIPAGQNPSQLVPVKSRTFHNWLLATFQANHGFLPRPSALRQAIRSLESEASQHPPVCIAVRVASTSGKVLLDLHNPSSEAVEITPRGWRTTWFP